MSGSFLDGAEVLNGAQAGPYFGIIYGPPKVGKSHLATYAPNPWFVPVDTGVASVTRGKKLIKDGKIIQPKTADQLFEMMHFFLRSKQDKKTIILDAAKGIQELFHNDVISKNPTVTKKNVVKTVTSITDYDFGRGYGKAIDLWNKLLIGIEALNEAGHNVILVAHSHYRNINPPDGESYKIVDMDLTVFGDYNTPGLLQLKADWVYYMTSEAKTIKQQNNFGMSKTVALTGSRPTVLVYTRATSLYFAGVRATNEKQIPDYYELTESDLDADSQRIFNDLEA